MRFLFTFAVILLGFSVIAIWRSAKIDSWVFSSSNFSGSVISSGGSLCIKVSFSDLFQNGYRGSRFPKSRKKQFWSFGFSRDARASSDLYSFCVGYYVFILSLCIILLLMVGFRFWRIQGTRGRDQSINVKNW